MAVHDLTLTDAVKHIQQNIQQTLPDLNDDVNNLFEIICELQAENDALKAELIIAKGTGNSAGKAGTAELGKSMASKIKIFIKHFCAKRGEPIKAEEERDLIECINMVVNRVVPLPQIRK